MAFDATVAGASATSYLTLEAAETYFLDRLQVDPWDDADEDERQEALMMATARLDVENYYGYISTQTQRLSWPRTSTYDRHGRLLASDAIPEDIQDATCELALAILSDPDALTVDASLSAFQNLRLGSLDITPRTTGQTTLPLPPGVLRLLLPYRIGGFQNRVVRA